LDKEPRPEIAATKQNGIQQDPQEDPRAGVREASSWGVQQVAEGETLNLVEGEAHSGARIQKLDVVEGSGPSEKEEETPRNCGNPASLQIQSSILKKTAAEPILRCTKVNFALFYAVKLNGSTDLNETHIRCVENT
jgi:hypothetical protein